MDYSYWNYSRVYTFLRNKPLGVTGEEIGVGDMLHIRRIGMGAFIWRLGIP
jgi:hypothetical protein